MPTVRLTAVLTTNGANLANKVIHFYYRKTGSPWVLVSSVATNANGVAQTDVELEQGTYDFRAHFAGDDDYEPSEAVVYSFNVAGVAAPTTKVQIPWIALLAAVMLLLLLIAAREEERGGR